MADGIDVRAPMAGLGIAASGLSAQRARIDAVATNLANAETTRGVDGTPYRRKVVLMQEVPFSEVLGAENEADVPVTGGVRVSGIEEDLSEGLLIYDPGHPDADGKGYVRMPNVSVTQEMADLMDARNLFEANATVFQAVKNMLRRATQL